MRVVSLNIGHRKQVQWKNRIVETGIFKNPVNHPIFLDKLNVKSDTIADLKRHGGVDKAVYLYSEQHYDYWKALYPEADWQYGMFGENITLTELDEHKIKKGDLFQIGDAVIEATKPRTPCYKLGIRFKDQQIVKQFWKDDKCGVYCKVLKSGEVNLNDRLILEKTDASQPTIAAIYQIKKQRFKPFGQ